MARTPFLILRRPPFETPPRRLLRVNQSGRLEGRGIVIHGKRPPSLPRQRTAGGLREMHGDDAAGGMVGGARRDRADGGAAVESDEGVAGGGEVDAPHDAAAR